MREPCVAGSSGCVPGAARILVGVPTALEVRCSRPADLRSWSLGRPEAEAITGTAKETLERWTRRNHCRKLSDSPDVVGAVPVNITGWLYVFLV